MKTTLPWGHALNQSCGQGLIGIPPWPCSLSSSLVLRSAGRQSSVSKAGPLPASGSQGARAMNHRSVLLLEPGRQGPVIYLTWNELDYLNRLEESSPLILWDSSWPLRVLSCSPTADTQPLSPFLCPSGMPALNAHSPHGVMPKQGKGPPGLLVFCGWSLCSLHTTAPCPLHPPVKDRFIWHQMCNP